MTSKTVFISFASPQADIAKRMAAALRRRNVTVFFSNDSIRPDEIALRVIKSKLASPDMVFVPIFSVDYFKEGAMSLQEYDAFVLAHRGNVKGRLCVIRLDDYDIDHFDKNYQYQSASSESFTKDIKRVINSIIMVVNSDSIAINPEDSKAVEASLTERLLIEWNRIISRSKETTLSTKSMSQIYMFGWLASCGFAEPKLNPRISAFYIRYIVRNVFHVFKDKSKERVNIECSTSQYVAYLCTIRFLMFCFLAASGEENYPEYILKCIVGGLNRRDYSEQKNLVSVISLSEELIAQSEKGNDCKKLLSELLNNMSAIARNFNLSLSDVMVEEASPHRSQERMSKNAIIESHNTVTHSITLFIEDREGIYYKIMEIFGHTLPRFNVIKSTSETHIPEKIASIHLDICCRTKDVGVRMREVIKDNPELDRAIFSVQIVTV